MEQALAVLGGSGRLRVAINYGNSVLVQKNQDTGEPCGVSVDLARKLGAGLGLDIEYFTYHAARFVVDAIKADQCDLGFLAVDPLRGEYISYTRPYVAIAGGYLAKSSAPYATVDDVDEAGVRIAVGKNAAYDLYLSRTLESAELVRAPTTADVVDLYLSQNLDLAAGIKSSLLAYAANRPEFKVLDGAFMEIQQAIGVSRRNEAAVPYLDRFLAEMAEAGFIRSSLEKSGQDPDVAVMV